MAEVATGSARGADSLFGGRIVLHQPRRGEGYRVNVDALLLASFAGAGKHARSAFDLGAGVGAVGLALLHLDVVDRITLVEADPEAAGLARDNLRDNAWQERSEVVEGDVLAFARARRGTADLVVCNPPFVSPGRGRLPAVAARARARAGDLARFVDAARLACGRRGRACFVYPAHDLVTLGARLRASGLEPKRLRMVQATASKEARVVLVEAVPGKPGGLHVEPPLVERQGAAYSPEVLALLGR